MEGYKSRSSKGTVLAASCNSEQQPSYIPMERSLPLIWPLLGFIK